METALKQLERSGLHLKSLTEYLYGDKRRVDTYFEQISSPTRYDKVPVWKAEAGLLGPKAEATQARFPRPFTTLEEDRRAAEFLKNGDLAGVF